MTIKVNPVQYKLALIYATHTSQDCINDPDIPQGLKDLYKEHIRNVLANKLSFTDLQRMHYFLTGECIAFLP